MLQRSRTRALLRVAKRIMMDGMRRAILCRRKIYWDPDSVGQAFCVLLWVNWTNFDQSCLDGLVVALGECKKHCFIRTTLCMNEQEIS